jgi:thymidylate kinase
MQIELIGCTSAGKSTLASGIVSSCRQRGIALLTSDEFVLKQIWLDWIPNYLLRTILVDFCSLIACLATWQTNSEFYIFAVRLILRLPIRWHEKPNLIRNVLKKIGIYEIIRCRNGGDQVVIVDEGTLHAAHNLFVHISARLSADDFSNFTRLVPLPEVAVYVTQSKSVMFARMCQRGHPRVPKGSPDKAELFITRAVETFDKLAQHSMLDGRLLVVDGQRNVIVGQEYQHKPVLAKAARIIRAGLEASTAAHLTDLESAYSA